MPIPAESGIQPNNSTHRVNQFSAPNGLNPQEASAISTAQIDWPDLTRIVFQRLCDRIALRTGENGCVGYTPPRSTSSLRRVWRVLGISPEKGSFLATS